MVKLSRSQSPFVIFTVHSKPLYCSIVCDEYKLSEAPVLLKDTTDLHSSAVKWFETEKGGEDNIRRFPAISESDRSRRHG